MFHRLPPLVLVLTALAAQGCGSSNRLDEVALAGRRVAVTAAVPPAPRVQAGSQLEAGIDVYDPVGTAVRLGTSEVKRRQAARAQTRLDSVAARVDVADRIARRSLAGAAAALRFAPATRPQEAAYVLDIRVADYGLVADSFEGATYFVLGGEVHLLDAGTGEVLWSARLDERETVDRTVFGLPVAAGNVVTGRALAGLSVQEMATGLGRLADLTADRLVGRLVRDYRDAQ